MNTKIFLTLAIFFSLSGITHAGVIVAAWEKHEVCGSATSAEIPVGNQECLSEAPSSAMDCVVLNVNVGGQCTALAFSIKFEILVVVSGRVSLPAILFPDMPILESLPKPA